MIHHDCPKCGEGFDVDIDMANVTADSIQVLVDAQAAHAEEHRVAESVGESHIRRQIARKRGNSFYKVQYGPTEDGSQTLCGAQSTVRDMSYGETRHASGRAYVTCDNCKKIREGK